MTRPALTDGALLWEPTAAVQERCNLTRYADWLAAQRGLTFADYAALWRWSVTHLSDFWQSIWDYCGVVASQPAQSAALTVETLPGARWFEGARLNYAENFFARPYQTETALLYKAEDRPLCAMSRAELAAQVAALSAALRALGVQPGDRVVAYLPNIPQTVVALLATAAVGAIWSTCSPDFGSQSVLDRFQQIEPTVLLAADGYRYGGKAFDRRETIAALQAGLPTLRHTILVRNLDGAASAAVGPAPDGLDWDALLRAHAGAPLQFTQVPFDHPLWVLYSSGTTGRPKPIVHGHGGILLEHLKMSALHLDLHPGDRFFWFTGTGWMMWNFLVGGLLADAAIVLYDGSPAYPDLYALWELAAAVGVTYFGASAAYVAACQKAGVRPNQRYDLRQIAVFGSTGSPLSVDGFAWVYENVNPTLALESVSGGTDVCTAFVGGCRRLPIYAGEIQGPCLGADVQAWNEAGEPVVNEVGELVIARPMPSMPLYFWNDPDGAQYRAGYFEHFPGFWRHGDWIQITPRGGCIIFGRSDATINRHGVRMGTAELYRVVEALPEILDSLAIDLQYLGREPRLLLFVVLRPGHTLDDALRQRIRDALRRDVSPRHIPDDIFAIAEIPYTLSGKKMEVPVRRILLGQPVGQVAAPGAMRNPAAIDYFAALAGQLTDR